jgi:hypothetical protein
MNLPSASRGVFSSAKLNVPLPVASLLSLPISFSSACCVRIVANAGNRLFLLAPDLVDDPNLSPVEAVDEALLGVFCVPTVAGVLAGTCTIQPPVRVLAGGLPECRREK